MTDLIKAKELLLSGDYTCVVCKNNSIYTSKLRGVKPLFNWYTDKMDFSGFSAADKVVGKGAAFLYVMLNVKNIYAGVISSSALEVLQKHHIDVEYKMSVDNIINRKGNGICPFEAAVLNIEDKDEAYEAIWKKVQELGV